MLAKFRIELIVPARGMKKVKVGIVDIFRACMLE